MVKGERMKNLITVFLLLLIVGSSYADTKISIFTGSKYEMEITGKSEEEAKSKLVDVLAKSTWMKCIWNEIEAGSIVSKSGIDMEGNPITSYCHPVSFRIEILPFTSEVAIEDAINAKVKCGQDTIKFIAKNNVLKGLDNAQIKSMAMTYSTVFSLLNAGAIDTALIDINAMIPDGTIVTYEDKTKIINFINTCN